MRKSVFDFLAATMEHENLKELDLDKYSSEYYHANQKVLAYQRKLQSALPAELQQTLIQLDDEYNCMLISGMGVHYRQDFSDAIHLMLETLTCALTRS